jgi:predicted dehydrogenase
MTQDTTSTQAGGPTRREFIYTSGAALAAATMAGRTARAGNKKLRVGLIGCGGRGTGAAHQALNADPDTELHALADLFDDQLQKCLQSLQKGAAGERVNVPKSRQYVGFDAYQKLIDSCDVVLHATTPHFRPLHLEATIAAGKHTFVEKPIATDPAGVRRVRAACEKARSKGISVVTGLCYRYENAKRETIKRIQDGAIGDITALQTTYNTGTLWHRGHKPEWSEMEYQIRNWLYFDWLSGDHIVEQHIHSLDKVAWAMGDKYPVKATASGGRIQRTDEKWGNIYDHFNTVYEFENGVRAFSSCRQWGNADTDVSDHAFGTEGVARIQSHRVEGSDGTVWQHEKDPKDDMYQNEHDQFFASIRSGEPINNGEIMCNSTLMAIMGRLSAYSGRTVTWDEMLQSELDLSLPNYAWGDAPQRPVAVPGRAERT